MSVESDPVPPLPQHTPPINKRAGALERFENNWMQWFTAVRNKINIINALIVNFSKITGNGFIVLQNSANWFTRTLVQGTGIVITNADGTAGDPIIDHADTSSVSDLNSNNSGTVVLQDFSIAFDSMGHVQSVAVGTTDLASSFDPAGSAAAALVAAMDYTDDEIAAITPESIGMAPGYDNTQGNRLTDLDAVFGSKPFFFSADSTATGSPVAFAGQGVFIPFSATGGMMFFTRTNAADENRRLFIRQGSGSTWGSWIELAFRYWNGLTAASGSFTPNLDLNDAIIRTALSANVTISNPTGTKVNGRILWVRLRDNGTARTITWGTEYRSMTATLPATTVINKTVYCQFIVNADENTLDLVNVQRQP